MLVCEDFIYTLEIITRILREVVNRVKLGGHHTRRDSRFITLSLGISSHSEDHRAHFTRSGKQSEIGRSARPRGFLSLYRWEFRLTLNVIARILR